MILQGLKARIIDPIEKYGAKWLQELPRVVWGLRTKRSRATGYSPFFMVYGSEAVLPSDIAFGAPRIQNYDENEAEATRCCWRRVSPGRMDTTTVRDKHTI